MNKKGISPLIGTVLLVAIVIAMVLLIMPWVSDLIKQQQERSTAALTKLDCIDKLKFKLLINSDNMVVVENIGQVDIISLTFRKYDINGKIIGTSEREEGDLANPKVPMFESFVSGISCGSDIDKVEATATIRADGDLIPCEDKLTDTYCY